jgi:hypothetical protein
MPPVLLYRETFSGAGGSVDLSTRTPVPGPGAAGEYKGASTRYKVEESAGGYGYGTSTVDSVVRYPDWLTPPNTRFRIVMDVFREGVDFVGGGLTGRAFVPSEDILTWDFLDNLTCEIRRNSLTETDARMTWKKHASEPPPAEVVYAFAGSVQHGPNEGVRYEFEVDEANRVSKIFLGEFGIDRPLFGLEGDIEPVVTGTFPDELAAHLAADRLIGWDTERAAFGLVAFRLYLIEVWDMGTPVVISGPPCKLLLEVFDDDGVTVLWSTGTDPAHAHPYLKEPTNYGEQQIDVATGTASLTTVSVTVIDPAQIPGDQDSGWLTERLAFLNIANLGGRRCRLIRYLPDGMLGYQVIADGPASQPVMVDNYSAFTWQIRDTRDTERKLRLFDVIHSTGDITTGATPAGPEEPGTDPSFTWGTEYH